MNFRHRSVLAFAVVILSAFAAGCSGVGVLNTLSPIPDDRLQRDLPYGSHGMRLDVYEPAAARADAPVIVFIYGGSWQKSATLPKEQYRFVGAAFAARGYVVVIPDYRLYPDTAYPGFLEDCAQAVAWTHENAATIHARPEQLALLGHSAGAYNAAMLALDDRYLEAAGGHRDWIRLMVGLAGPYDFLPLEDQGLKDVFAPAVPLSSSQPIEHVDGGTVPMLLLAGHDDRVVYAKNTENLAATLRDRDVEVEEYVYPHMSHSKIIATVGIPLQPLSDVADRIDAFVRKNVEGPAAPAVR